MKLLVTERIDTSDEKTNFKCTIVATDDGFVVSYESQSIRIDTNSFRASQMQYLMWGSTRIALVDQATFVDSRDWPAVMARMGFEKEIGALYCGDTTDEMALVITEACKTQALCETVEPAAPAQMIATIFPKALELRRRNAAKMNLLNQINPMDSLASLEKQVDLLTLLVIELAGHIPQANDSDLLAKTSNMLAQASSVSSMTTAQAIDNIANFKAYLRTAVAQYFSERAA